MQFLHSVAKVLALAVLAIGVCFGCRRVAKTLCKRSAKSGVEASLLDTSQPYDHGYANAAGPGFHIEGF
jgi:hypothetical protein